MINKKSGFFKNIGIKALSYFHKNKWQNNVIDKSEKQLIKNELQENFDNYLEVEDAFFCLEMIEAGYVANQKQIDLLTNIVTDKVLNKQLGYEELVQFTSVIEKNKSLLFPILFDYAGKNEDLEKQWVLLVDKESIDTVLEKFMKFMVSFQTYYKDGLNSLDKFENFKYDELNVYFEHFDTFKNLFKQLYNHGVMDGESFMSFSKHLEHTVREIKLVTNKGSSSSFSFERIKLSYLEQTRLEMKDYAVKQSNPKNKEEILKKIKIVSNEYLNNNIKNLARNRNYSVSQLEEENQQQIKMIEKLTTRLDNTEVNEFIEERVPLILEKYLSIDKEYRKILKSVEGFNAQELMTQSLDNIIVLLKEKLENKNADFITELSIENRKIKAKV